MFFSSAHKPQLLFYFLLLDLEPDFPSGERLHYFWLVPKSGQRNEARVSVVNDKRMKRSTWTFTDSEVCSQHRRCLQPHTSRSTGSLPPGQFGADLVD